MDHPSKDNNTLFESLKIDCSQCFGLCCTALYFSASEGFPTNKKAGDPCPNLHCDFSCAIHKDLSTKGLKGCMAYDCFGAGQKVAVTTYKNKDWRQSPHLKEQMFDVFLLMRQLHEMLWYLTEALTFTSAPLLAEQLQSMLTKTEQLTHLSPDELLKLDLTSHRSKVNPLLLETSELVRKQFASTSSSNPKSQKNIVGRSNFFGADLRSAHLKGADLKGAFLIAANLSNTDLSGAVLIGADLRDADIRGANLSHTLFLTQAQINTAKGNTHTKLPAQLTKPSSWV